MNATFVLGINAYDHDVSACLLKDGEIAVAISKERLTRNKNASGFHDDVVEYCLATAGIELADLRCIVRNSYVLTVADMERRLCYNDTPEYLSPEERHDALTHPLFDTNDPRCVDISHHLAHAYSAFACGPFAECAVMVVDGVGSYAEDVTEPLPEAASPHYLARESESYYHFDGENLSPVRKIWMEPAKGFLSDEFHAMDGLGALYSRVSSYVFGDWNKCGEVMGLAAFGNPDALAPLVSLRDGDLVVAPWPRDLSSPWVEGSQEAWEAAPQRSDYENLAARIQADAEEILLQRARDLHEATGSKNLCLAGGVALNCVANGRLLREGPFDDIWVQPAASDDGIAIGCAYYGYLELLGESHKSRRFSPYLGKPYPTDDVKNAIAELPIPGVIRSARKANVAAAAARLLAEGNVMGWFQGGSEFGPRALGNRSLLADPRDPAMKERLNARVKHRQAFRPFAPVVLEHRAAEVFDLDRPSPYMLFAADLRPEWSSRVPSILHVDGSARVQTVSEFQNPMLFELLTEFDRLTGVPVLLNTSFNIRGEPIVETPRDAVSCFLGTGIDTLVLQDMLVRKGPLYGLYRPIHGFRQKFRANLQHFRELT